MKKWIPAAALALALVTAAGAGYAASARYTAEAEPGGWNRRVAPYTKADYALAQSLQSPGYRDMAVSDFNASVFVPGDEAAFHKTEDALRRLTYTLPDTDPLSPFVSGPLSRTWDECAAAHYNACEQDRLPLAEDQVRYDRYEDVYGDKLLVASATAEFWCRYLIPDGAVLTVGEREDFFQALRDGMQLFLDKQSEDSLRKPEPLEKALLAELRRLTGVHGGEKISAKTCGLVYWWNS